ncbi:curli production assembly/transport protein CsgE [Hymenobacter aerilatus]|uniref:Curli production assembly/transport component CsgE n=1 Tax=Hymenobacter aerilatus TaxID=2932251 RepID=A0A8T9SP76_9BACT|nr:curli production assembly/transport protein CsgE [Hymenobacter aerilatus]UOR03605.1 curli production assembly/transport protein CsgE [Hymenobacter aerilatus]
MPAVYGQAERRAPVRANQPTKADSKLPGKQESKQLSPKKVEEALRLLLRADSLQSSRAPTGGPESSGLVVDQTVTKIGHDFYDAFYAGFEAPVGIQDFVVTISERPARGNSALVALSVNNEDLLEFPLQPRQELVEEAAAQAIALAVEYLQISQDISRQLEQGERRVLEVY